MGFSLLGTSRSTPCACRVLRTGSGRAPTRIGPPGEPVSLPPRDEQGPAPRGEVSRQARVLPRRTLRLEGRELAVVRGRHLVGGARRDRLPPAPHRASPRGGQRRPPAGPLGPSARRSPGDRARRRRLHGRAGAGRRARAQGAGSSGEAHVHRHGGRLPPGGPSTAGLDRGRARRAGRAPRGRDPSPRSGSRGEGRRARGDPPARAARLRRRGGRLARALPPGWPRGPSRARRRGARVSYDAAGVSLAKAEAVVERLRAAVESTRTPGAVGPFGAFAGLFELDDERLLAATTDSVGTKLILSRRAGRLFDAGADLAAHCVNDVLTTGAEPLFFLDYVASGALDLEDVASLVEGAASVCREAGCAVLGGETAELPGVYREGELDFAGTCVGLVRRAELVDGTRCGAGDAVIGLPSAGLHANGFT